MKKTLFFVTALFTGAVAFGQTTEVKEADGTVVTPQAGDWAVGMNAAPLFNYVGNMFNGSTGNTLNTAFVNQTPQSANAIYGKYFVDENTAYRGQLRLMQKSGTSIALTDTNTIHSTPSYVEDKYKQSGANVVLGFGLEKRRGHNRLQGYYGAEALITFGGVNPKVKNEYGVALDSVNIAHGGAVNGRVVEAKGGATFGVGVRGFIGAEYFFAPKISIAAEYGWGLSYAKTGERTTKTEYYGFETSSDVSKTTYKVETKTGKSSSFGIDTDNFGGAIRLMFHF